MTLDAHAGSSPLVSVLGALADTNESWVPEVGLPSGPGWIAGADLRVASAGPFNELLLRIGERAKTIDRKTIAASFALRYGWASAMAIAPFCRSACVPDITLENISLKFRGSTFLERTAIHEPRGVMLDTGTGVQHPMLGSVISRQMLLRVLRAALTDQATPVVEALYQWAGFSRRGTWGMLTSAWAAHFTGFFQGQDQREVRPDLELLFAGEDVVSAMQPRLHAVTYRDVTHLYQRRASCCRWYLLPGGDLCTSCPLVSHHDRVTRNLAWMQRQLAGPVERRSHA